MQPNRIIGIVLVVVGVVLLSVGLNSSDSIADRLSSTFTGRFTDATNWYIYGGIALAVVGFVVGAIGFGKRSGRG